MNFPDRVPAPRDHRSQFPWWAWAGAALLLLFSIFSIWQSREAQSQLVELQSRLHHQKVAQLNLHAEKTLAELGRDIVSDPASVRFILQAKSAPALHVFWHAKLGIFIYGANVPIPGPDRACQLWLIPKQKNAEPILASVFRPDATGTITLVLPILPAPIHSTAALAISEKPVASSGQLDSTPIWLGSVPQ
jgi:hypothetical protein